MSETQRVLVLDGETRTALACVRALGRRGHRVEVVASKPSSLAAASKFCVREHVIADSVSDPLGWAADVEALTTESPSTTWILPVTEISLGSLFAAGTDTRRRVLCADRRNYERVVDKHALLLRARELGIAVPSTHLLEHPSPDMPLPDGFDYPVVLKPRRSRWLSDGRWRAGEVIVVHDEPGWRDALGDPGMAAGALVQTWVEGHGEAVFMLTQGGHERVHFAHRRLREKPPTGGLSVLRTSIEVDPGLLEQSRRLLEGLNWEGVAMIEFRRKPGGRAWLMEINPRLWGSLQLAIDAGVDFPNLMLEQALGREIDMPQTRLGVKTRWLLGDFDHLLTCLRRPPVRASTGRNAMRVIIDFALSFFDGSRTEVFRWDDARPFWRELSRWAQK